jgi:coproporphyrinogen III oxidase
MDLPAVEQYLKGLQRSICEELSAIDGAASF